MCACVYAAFDVLMRPSALAANKEAEVYQKAETKADAASVEVELEGEGEGCEEEADADDELLLQRLACARDIIRLRQMHVYCPP